MNMFASFILRGGVHLLIKYLVESRAYQPKERQLSGITLEEEILESTGVRTEFTMYNQ